MGDSVRPVRAMTYGAAKSSCTPSLSTVRRSASAPDLLDDSGFCFFWSTSCTAKLVVIKWQNSNMVLHQVHYVVQELFIIVQWFSQKSQFNIWSGGGLPSFKVPPWTRYIPQTGYAMMSEHSRGTHNTFLYICCHSSIVITYLIGQIGRYRSQYINLYLETISVVWWQFDVTPESGKGHGGW